MAANVAAGAAGGPVAAAMSQVAEAGASKAAADLKKIQDRNFSRHRVALERLHGPMSAAGSARSRENQRQDGDLNTLNPDAAKILQQPAPASQSPPLAVRPPITRTAGGELVQPGTPMNPNARWQKPGAPVTHQSVTPPVTRHATVTPPVTPKSVTPPVTPLSPQQEKQFAALGARSFAS